MNTNSKTPPSSTSAFFQEADQIPEFSRFDRLHGYVYIRWPYLYIGIGKGEHPLSKILARIWKGISTILPQSEVPEGGSGTFADGYHGKVMPTESAKHLVTIGQEICIEDLEQVIPYPKARAIILQNPDHIVALECPCRSAKENPCRPLDVCLIVGEPFASFVNEHHPNRSHWISSNEAVEILEAEQARGHVSHAFFKDAMLGRFYAICNCCECCCGAINAHRNGTPMLASSGYICKVDREKCLGCGTCEEICQFQAISVSDGFSVVTYEECMGCGICVAHCAQDALSLAQDEQKGIPLDIQTLVMETEAAA